MAGDAPDFSVGTVDLSPIVVNTMPLLKNYPGGNVFFFDNFEGSDITWEIIKKSGADYCFAEIDKTHAYIGTGCARLYRNEQQMVSIYLRRQFQFRSSDTIGVEFSFMFSGISSAKVEFEYYYIINNTRYKFYISFEENDIKVETPQGNITFPYSPGNDIKDMVWHNVKLIINTKDHRYVRLYYGKDVFNIDYSSFISSQEGEKAPTLRLGFFSNWPGDAQKGVWIDKVILTDDETI